MADNSEQPKPKRGGPGRPFKPGQSGNPGGKPKAAKELRDKLLAAGDELVEMLRQEALNGNTHALLRALEYVLGKPAQPVEVGGSEGGPVQVVVMAFDGSESGGGH